jgi:1-acyl-sn-glycerol-3-phosphate acyltransferase
MKLFNLLYTFWCGFIVMSLFLLLYPIIFIWLQFDFLKVKVYRINYYWCKLFCFFSGISIEVHREFEQKENETYIYCGSHFSPIDNFTINLLVESNFVVIGDTKIGDLPLYGYMFRKLHILVDRKNQDSRNKALLKAIRMLKQGRSIIMSPEGGIASRNPPNLYHPFEDGAFIMAIHLQLPIVPMTSTTTYKILPDVKKYPRIHRKPFKATIHKPIETKGMTMDDLEHLKEITYNIMNEGLGNTLPKANFINPA